MFKYLLSKLTKRKRLKREHKDPLDRFRPGNLGSISDEAFRHFLKNNSLDNERNKKDNKI